jgi:hypothetical protein
MQQDERIVNLAAMDQGLSKDFLVNFSIFIEEEVAKRVN